MPTVDELFDRYRAAYRAGEQADPRSFLAQLPEADRPELEALIVGFLVTAEGRPFDADRFARNRESPLRAGVRAAIEAEAAETWATLLPHARDEAKVTRANLVARLAAALGVSAKQDKVAAYYHQMETGRLPARGVSDRVLDALASIVGVSAARLRAAGERLAPPAAPGAPVFARSRAAPAPAAAAAPAQASPPPEPDEVDRLFTGGAGAPEST